MRNFLQWLFGPILSSHHEIFRIRYHCTWLSHSSSHSIGRRVIHASFHITHLHKHTRRQLLVISWFFLSQHWSWDKSWFCSPSFQLSLIDGLEEKPHYQVTLIEPTLSLEYTMHGNLIHLRVDFSLIYWDCSWHWSILTPGPFQSYLNSGWSTIVLIRLCRQPQTLHIPYLAIARKHRM